MTRLLITGSRGQLGSTLKHLLSERNDIEACFTCSDGLDITRQSDWETAISEFRPEFIINCAAYTAVDKAEDHCVQRLPFELWKRAFFRTINAVSQKRMPD